MNENKNIKNNTCDGAENCTFDNKSTASSIISVVKNEIYPERRTRKDAQGTSPTFSHTPKTTHKNRIITDPNGSYTGTPIIHGETPVQDVDDL